MLPAEWTSPRRSPAPKPVFTPRQIAQVLHVHIKTIHRWLKDPNHPLSGEYRDGRWILPAKPTLEFLRSLEAITVPDPIVLHELDLIVASAGAELSWMPPPLPGR